MMSCSKEPAGNGSGEDESFSVAVEVTDVTASSAVISFSPSSQTLPYIAGYVSSSDLGPSDIKYFIDNEISQLMEREGLDRAEAVAEMQVTGSHTMSPSDLSPETGYVCYAVGVNADGYYTTDAFAETFETPAGEAQTGDISFEIDIPEVTASSVSVSVLPSDNTLPYYYDLMTKDVYDSCDGDVASYLTTLIENASAEYGVDKEKFVKSLQVTGPDSDNISGLPSDTEMIVYAIGLADDGTCYGEPEVKSFRTLAPGNPEDCEFSFDFSYAMSGVTVTVTPSDDGVSYYTSVIPVSEFSTDDALVERVYQGLLSMASEYGVSVSQIVSMVAFTGQDIYEWTELAAEDHYAFAYALSDDGRAAGPVFMEKFTVPEYASDVSVSVENVRWFNGDDLADMDSQYEGIRDGAYFVADVVHSSDAYQWYLALLPGDYTDSESYPDETVYDAVMMGGVMNREQLRFVVQYGTLTVLGFAVDIDGVYGDIYRMSAEITREGASPVSEFSTSGLSAADASAGVFPSASLQKGRGTEPALLRLGSSRISFSPDSVLPGFSFSRFNRQ